MRYLLSIFAFLAVGVALLLLGWLFRLHQEIRFDVDKIVYYDPPLTTQFLDRKGRLIANVFDQEFRFYTSFDEIPTRIIEALIAVEDTLFFEHSGINLDAISRAMIKNIQERRFSEGGSTITQQLVKNVVLSREKTFDRKIKEAILALELERVLTKEEILERYFNHTYFGHGYYGIKAASRGYFKKEMDRLTLKEAAMLMALPRAPSFYDPTKNFDFSLGRANNILQRMYALGWINEEEFQGGLQEIPIVYNETLTQNIAPYVVDEAAKELNYLPNLRSGGYTIKLNIDLDYQEAAREALIFGRDGIIAREQERIAQAGPDLNATQEGQELNATLLEDLNATQTGDITLNGAIIVLENKTGKILAMVGGVNYRQSPFNRATQAKRQPGSSFKPFVYQIALNAGYGTNSPLADIARTYAYTQENPDEPDDRQWRPKNYGETFRGLVPLKEAVVRSLNLATINLTEAVGFSNIYEKSVAYGFRNLPKNLSMVLGSFSISPLEMSEAYTLFSNYGTILTPSLISSVTDRYGVPQQLAEKPEPRVITSPEQSYLMTDILKEAVNRGTGQRAKVKGIEIAGKTGSTNANVDAWFCGFSPTIQAVVWYGRDDNTPIGFHETGGLAAAPAFNQFFKNLLTIEPGIKREFDIPPGVRKATHEGVTYYYTETSPLNQEAAKAKEENLLF